MRNIDDGETSVTPSGFLLGWGNFAGVYTPAYYVPDLRPSAATCYTAINQRVIFAAVHLLRMPHSNGRLKAWHTIGRGEAIAEPL